MHRTVFMLAGLLAALLVGAPAGAADNGLTVLAVPPASNGQTRLQVEVTDPALQNELRTSQARENLFRVVVENAGAQVKGARRMADSNEGSYTVLAFDQSGSFAPYWSDAFQLAKAYADALGPRASNHTVAVMTFGQSKTTHCEERSAAGLQACLDKVAQSGTRQLVTRLKFYIQQAVREAASKQPLSRGGSREVIVFTDAGEESAALKVKDLATEARDKGVRVQIVVFSPKSTGKRSNAATRLDEMSQLAEGSGGRYIQVGDVDARQAVTGLVGALENLYWLDVGFCGVKRGQSTGRLSVEGLSGGATTAWSDSVSFRQKAEGSATAACPGSVATGPSPARTGTGSKTGTSGSVTPPGKTTGNPGTSPSTQPGPTAGTPGSPSQPGTPSGSPGTAAQPGGTPGAPDSARPSSGLPWWLIALLIGLGLLLLGVLIALLTRRRSEPAPAPQVAPPVAAPVPTPEPPAPQPEPAPATPAWKDPFATLPETRLVVVRGPAGLEPFYRVHKSAFSIGARAGEMDLPVDLPQLSGHHATVQLFKGGNVFVKDEHSTNGTFVDGRRLNPGERVQVRPGQSIRLSQYLEFTLVQPGLQPSAEPPAGVVPVVAAPPAQPSAAQPSAEAPRAKARTLYSPARGDDE